MFTENLIIDKVWQELVWLPPIEYKIITYSDHQLDPEDYYSTIYKKILDFPELTIHTFLFYLFLVIIMYTPFSFFVPLFAIFLFFLIWSEWYRFDWDDDVDNLANTFEKSILSFWIKNKIKFIEFIYIFKNLVLLVFWQIEKIWFFIIFYLTFSYITKEKLNTFFLIYKFLPKIFYQKFFPNKILVISIKNIFNFFLFKIYIYFINVFFSPLPHKERIKWIGAINLDQPWRIPDDWHPNSIEAMDQMGLLTAGKDSAFWYDWFEERTGDYFIDYQKITTFYEYDFAAFSNNQKIDINGENIFRSFLF